MQLVFSIKLSSLHKGIIQYIGYFYNIFNFEIYVIINYVHSILQHIFKFYFVMLF